jgi:hypothetical protein
VRPRGKAIRKPRHNIIIGSKRTFGGLMGQSPGGSEVSLPGVRSPPLRGGFQARMAFRRKPWHNAKGDFLGGTRSPRPHCRAVREPRHSKIIGGKRIHGGRMGTCSGEANFAVAGVRSPPLRGEDGLREDGLAGKTLV